MDDLPTVMVDLAAVSKRMLAAEAKRVTGF
jgi:hypothetical protein